MRSMTRLQYQLLVGILFLLLLAAISAAGRFYYRESSAPGAAAEVQQQEAVDVITAVGNLMVLPEGEEPTVATVTDLEQLRGQPFFAQAKVGHKLLIYTKAKKVILYDPIINKIVEISPLNIDAAAQ